MREARACVDATRVVTTPGTMQGLDTSSAVFSSSTISLHAHQCGEVEAVPW